MDKNTYISNLASIITNVLYTTLGKATILNNFDLATTQKDGARFIKAINS